MASRPGRKRKVNVERFPGGDIKPQEEVSPAVAKRMMLAASAKMLSEEWGTVLGRYLLSGKITQEQYQAGRSFGNLCETYSRIMGGPKTPKGTSLEKFKSQEVDVDSYRGEIEKEEHIIIIEQYNRTKIIIGCNELFYRVRYLCEGNGNLPENHEQFLLIKKALSQLAAKPKMRK
jgi:hypothetical protein